LLTTLLLESNGFAVARFISLERLIEENRESYYRSLQRERRDPVRPNWSEKW
jgi:Fic family protein